MNAQLAGVEILVTRPADLGETAQRNLAASSQRTAQRALGFHAPACVRIVERRQCRRQVDAIGEALDSQCALSDGWKAIRRLENSGDARG